jgi:peptide chain release factor 2
VRDFSSDISEVQRRVDEAENYLAITDNRERFAVLEAEVADPALWDDQDNARKLNTEYANLKDDLETFDLLSERVGDIEVLHELARDDDDASQEPEIESEITAVAAQLGKLELRSLFTGEHDDTDCIVQINAKDGGVDAQDFSEMLLRMYEKWCERRGFEITLNGVSEGAEAGIMSAEVTISGRYAYGLMTAERGTHRLVRISPFDNQGRRQTSFAAVQVWPLLEDVDLEVDESLRCRCSAHRVPAASTSTRPRLRCVTSTTPPGWWPVHRKSAVSSRTESAPWDASRA